MKIAVLGAGAVGCHYGGMLARAGHEVVLIGRAPHVEAIARHGLRVQTQTFDEYVRAPRAALSASADVAAVAGAALVLFCVKSTDTESAGALLKPHLARLAPGTLVLSLQNGVDNVARLRAVLDDGPGRAREGVRDGGHGDGRNGCAGADLPADIPAARTAHADVRAPCTTYTTHAARATACSSEAAPRVAAAVVYVAAEMAGPGHVRHHGRGELVLEAVDEPADDGEGGRAGNHAGGPASDMTGELVESAKLVESVGSGESSQSIESSAPGVTRKLAELLTDAGIPTEISANVRGALWAKLILNCTYNALSAILRLPYGELVQRAGIGAVMRDIVAECMAVARADGVTLPGQYSSTAQDLMRGRRTEIDHLNGLIARRGDALGVPAPVNRMLHAVVRGMEDGGRFGGTHRTTEMPR